MTGTIVNRSFEGSPARMRLLSEKSLGTRLAGGDRQAFGEVFRRYQKPLYAYCYSIVGNQDDGLDALQSTMAKALDSLPGEGREVKVKPWLFRVAHNECIDLIRSRKPTDDISEHELASSTEVETEVANRERLRQLLSDLGQLPDRQRNALVLRELNGLGFDEIALTIGASPAAAKQIVYEARCSLQTQSEGQSMACESARQAISGKDGRVLRGRKVRAHLRNCSQCSAFREGIGKRSGDLRSLMPPLPLVAVASMLQAGGAVHGGGAIATGVSGMASGGGVFGAAGIKAVAIVTVAASVGAVGVGVVERTGGDLGSNREIARSLDPGTSMTAVPEAAGVSYVELEGQTARPDQGVGDGPANQSGGNAKMDSDQRGESTPSQGGSSDSAGKSDSAGDDSSAGKVAGGSGGSKGRGAVPSHGGKPVSLPETAQKGQQQAEASQNKGKPTSTPASRPTPPAAPQKPVRVYPAVTKKAVSEDSSK